NRENTRLNVTGMTCAACSNRIEKVLNKMDGVDAKVNLATEQATVDYDKNNIRLDDITNKIENLGYGVQYEEVEFDISGMTCAACSNRIEKVLNKTDGVSNATVNLATENAVIEYNSNVLSERDLIARIDNLGYGATAKESAESREEKKGKELSRLKWKVVISALLSLPLLVTMLDHLFGMSLPAIFMNPWFQLAFATPVQFILGWQFYVGAYRSLKSFSANMDVLFAMGTTAAFGFSLFETYRWLTGATAEPHLYFEASAIIITLILFGKYLEARAKSQTSGAIKELMNMQAKEARVLRDGVETMIPAAEVAV